MSETFPEAPIPKPETLTAFERALIEIESPGMTDVVSHYDEILKDVEDRAKASNDAAATPVRRHGRLRSMRRQAPTFDD